VALGLKSRAISRFATAVLCILAAGAVGARMPVIGLVFACVGLVFAYLGFRDLRPARDPYDLKLLREIHEQEEIRNVRVPEARGDNVVCPTCGEVYGNDLPACPRCGRSGN
jgi:hypothetical protein